MDCLILSLHRLDDRGLQGLCSVLKLQGNVFLMLIKAKANGVKAILHVMALLADVRVESRDILLSLRRKLEFEASMDASRTSRACNFPSCSLNLVSVHPVTVRALPEAGTERPWPGIEPKDHSR